MKKSIVICMVTLVVLLLFSCSNKAQSSKEYPVKDILQKLYTVDSSASEKYSVLSKTGIINSSAIESIYSRFKKDMATKDYNAFIKNGIYLSKLKCAIKNDCTFRCKDISLTNAQIGDDAVQYNYNVTVIVQFKNNKEKTVAGKGMIQVIKQKNVWTVNWIKVIDDNSFFKDKVI